ncbi:MAG: Rrf2 family transcriptional regulator [Actinomycetota bacterium]|nr:Rrf2 family transcriptional regulator [Actinomycetota bacterium]
MRVTAKADYAIRAVVELGARHMEVGPSRPMKGDAIATAQQIPMKFCENILAELRAAGVVDSRRGTDGGYWLARDPHSVRLGDIIRIVEGPLAAIRGERPTDVEFVGASAAMREVWVAARAALRAVLDAVSVADVVAGTLPPAVAALLDEPGAWDTVRVTTDSDISH